jgi:N utilization substance protein B
LAVPASGASSRRQARERALALLYEADIKGADLGAVLDALPVAPDPFTTALLGAVREHRERIDGLISGSSIGWEVDRMAVVDRNVLRLAAAELIGFPGTPSAVILNEAVDLAVGYSTEDSGRFVNGVLATVAGLVRGA